MNIPKKVYVNLQLIGHNEKGADVMKVNSVRTSDEEVEFIQAKYMNKIDRIIDVVIEYRWITYRRLLKSKDYYASMTRFIIAYFLNRYTTLDKNTKDGIAGKLDYKNNNSSISSALKKIDDLIEVDHGFREYIKSIDNEIIGSL